MYPQCSREECKKDWTPIEEDLGDNLIIMVFDAPCEACPKQLTAISTNETEER